MCSSRIPFCNSRSTVASTVWGWMSLWVEGVYTLARSGWGRASQLGRPARNHTLRFRNPAGIRAEDPKNGILRVTATVATPPTSVTTRQRAVRVAQHASWDEAARANSARTAQRPGPPCQRRVQRWRWSTSLPEMRPLCLGRDGDSFEA